MLERKGIEHPWSTCCPGAIRRSCAPRGSAAAPCRPEARRPARAGIAAHLPRTRPGPARAAPLFPAARNAVPSRKPRLGGSASCSRCRGGCSAGLHRGAPMRRWMARDIWSCRRRAWPPPVRTARAPVRPHGGRVGRAGPGRHRRAPGQARPRRRADRRGNDRRRRAQRGRLPDRNRPCGCSLAYEDLRDQVEGRPAGDLAMRLLPGYPGPIPPSLPEWLTAPLSRSPRRRRAHRGHACGRSSSRSTSASSARATTTSSCSASWSRAGPGWPAAGLAIHAANGAVFGATYALARPRLPGPPLAAGGRGRDGGELRLLARWVA